MWLLPVPLGPSSVSRLANRRNEAERQKVAKEAQAEAERVGLPPVCVSIHFGGDSWSKSERSRIIAQTVQIVHAHLPTDDDAAVSVSNRFLEFNDFPEEIDAINILRTPGLTRHVWNNGRAGFVKTDFQDELQRSIDRKNRLLTDYLNNCNRCWLIVGADFEDASSFYQFSDEMSGRTFTSAFERTFFVDYSICAVHELKTSRP